MKRVLISILSSLIFALVMLGVSGCSQKSSIKHHKATKYTSKARHRATMRTYRVMGRTYSPTYVRVRDTMRGVSSWYGPNFHGKQTSNGERYDMHGMTAAHKTWPMDTMVRVDNLKNGKSVVVRINDRGPFVSGRVIDCSFAAGKKIGLDKTGIAPVRLTVLGFAGKVYRPSKSRAHSKPKALPSVELSNFGLQVGAFRRYEGAMTYVNMHKRMVTGKLRVIMKKFVVDGEPLYRVWIMGFGSDAEARDFMSDHSIKGGFLIRQ